MGWMSLKCVIPEDYVTTTKIDVGYEMIRNELSVSKQNRDYLKVGDARRRVNIQLQKKLPVQGSQHALKGGYV